MIENIIVQLCIAIVVFLIGSVYGYSKGFHEAVLGWMDDIRFIESLYKQRIESLTINRKKIVDPEMNPLSPNDVRDMMGMCKLKEKADEKNS